MERGRGLPRLVAHTSHEFSHVAGGAKRDPPAVARDDITVGRQPRRLDLQPLDRGIHEAHGSAGRAFLSHDVPGLEGLAQLDFDPRHGELPVFREAELEMRGEPLLA